MATPTLIACGQFCATHDASANLAACQRLFQLAVSRGAKLLFLPEASDYISRSPNETLELCTDVNASPFVLGLRRSAKTHSLPIVAGIHEPSGHAHQVRNTCIYISSTGEISHSYQKLHLFDVKTPEVTLTESITTAAGNEFCLPFATPAGILGLQICFDVRFPEGARWLVNRGAEILTYPSAFTVPTGRAHWELLLRARAVETQSWVVAPAQAGAHNEKRSSWGGACVIDPWGTVVARCKNGDEAVGEDVCFAEVDLAVGRRVAGECVLRRRVWVTPHPSRRRRVSVRGKGG